MLGEGIIQGLVETARNFFGSYVEKDRLTTVQYPEQRLTLPEASRNFPFLLYDGDGRGRGAALRGLPDLREGMPAAVHPH
jgi:NADH-quinone oxidoreductase subunit I